MNYPALTSTAILDHDGDTLLTLGTALTSDTDAQALQFVLMFVLPVYYDEPDAFPCITVSGDETKTVTIVGFNEETVATGTTDDVDAFLKQVEDVVREINFLAPVEYAS